MPKAATKKTAKKSAAKKPAKKTARKVVAKKATRKGAVKKSSAKKAPARTAPRSPPQKNQRARKRREEVVCQEDGRQARASKRKKPSPMPILDRQTLRRRLTGLRVPAYRLIRRGGQRCGLA